MKVPSKIKYRVLGEIPTYPTPEKEVIKVVVEYWSEDLPPRVIFIPKEEFPDKLAEYIRKDIEKRKAAEEKELELI